MKKRTFLLLEVLLAFSLVTLCIIPLVRQPLKLYKSEVECLEKLEMERLAEWTFSEIKEILLRNEIPWEKIPAKSTTSEPFPLSDAKVEIPGCKTRIIKRSFTLTGRGEKRGSEKTLYRQLGVYLLLNDHNYAFRLPVQKISN